jgi:hypothetical protein
MIIVLSIILLTISGLAEAMKDTLAHHFEDSVFGKLNPQFWNPVVSGANKWKDGKRENGEKFFLSSTLLVGLTEGWHLFKMISTAFIFSGIGLSVYSMGLVWGVIISRLVYGITFTLGYKYLRKN